ncbi:MAG: hypothetical protein IJH52_01465 [Oscillospiraceae bacterium]|nr:hypothetical protein [Oscillospiraceae bacterium]
MKISLFMIKHKVIFSVLFVLIALISIFILGPVFENPETYSKQIDSLTEKEDMLYKLTSASAVASVIISAVPGDLTSAIADAITDLTVFFVISLSAVFLEKYIITIVGLVIFRYILPIACALGILFLLFENNKFRVWGWKVAGFALVVILSIPLSTLMADQIVAINQKTIEYTIEAGNENNLTDEEDKESNGGIINSITNAINSASNSVKSATQKAKNTLRGFVLSVAVMLVATCVMPVLAFAIVLIASKFFFNLQFDVSIRKLHSFIRDSVHLDKDDDEVTV